MKDFAAIDFETANNERSSVCSVGIVIVRGGEIVDKFYSLIKPEPEYYNYWCSQVHGLCAADTEDAPIFPEVWYGEGGGRGVQDGEHVYTCGGFILTYGKTNTIL